MPLFIPPTLPGARETELGAANRDGISITAHATPHTKATSWTTLIAATTRDTYGFWLSGTLVAVSATVTNFLVDIGVGAASSEFAVVPNVQMGCADDVAGRGRKMYYFPVFIPAGSRISARGQAAITVDVCNLMIWLDQSVAYPMQLQRASAYGVNLASSNGTSVTPASGAFGSWTSVGSTTAREHQAFIPALDQLVDTTVTAEQWLLEIGTNSGTIIGQWYFDATAAEIMQGPIPPMPMNFAVPAGAQLQARLAGGSTEARGVIIYAFD